MATPKKRRTTPQVWPLAGKFALEGRSFHSVKGGVGRTHLATQAALEVARAEPTRPVYLIDMDLTGTSLADGLPLCPPRWSGDPKRTPELLADTAPDSYWRLSTDESSRTYLNEYLLFQTPDWAEETDCKVEAVCWKYEPWKYQGLENLHVLPSSAVPEDVNRILPVIDDEEHAAFLESRVEHLLAAILRRHPNERPFVAFDCPRGIYGVSRSILSLGLRLSSEPKQSLAQDGGVPHPLDVAHISWQAFFVMGDDIQDQIATKRWIPLAQPSERIHILHNSMRDVRPSV